MANENCDLTAPKLPRKGEDGQEICDIYGNRWVYDLETKTWISKGVITTPPVVTEENDGIVTPSIFEKLSKLRQFKDSDANVASLKLSPGLNAYWYYFRTSDKMFRFKPEGPDALRIEVDSGRLYQILLKQVCPGRPGLPGPRGDTGRDGVPGPPELCYAPIFAGDRIDFTIFTPAPLTLDGPVVLPNEHVPTISVRLYELPEDITNLVLKDQILALAYNIKDMGGPETIKSYQKIKQLAADTSQNIKAQNSTTCSGVFNEVIQLLSPQTATTEPVVTLDISPVDHTERSLSFNSRYAIDQNRTLDSIIYDQNLQVVCGSIYLESGEQWDTTQNFCLKSRQRGPDGPKGDPAECRVRIIECLVDDSNIVADCPIVNVRTDCDEDTIYTICSDLIEDYCVQNLQLLPTSAAVTTGNSLKAVFASAQMTLDDCKQINRFSVELPEVDVPELDLIHWDPQPGCFTQRHYQRYKFDWVPLTDKPACDIPWFSPTAARPAIYPHDLLIAPEPEPDECCQDDFFYCPSVQDGPCIGEPPSPPPPSPSVSAAQKASDIHELEINTNKAQQTISQGIKKWKIKT